MHTIPKSTVTKGADGTAVLLLESSIKIFRNNVPSLIGGSAKLPLVAVALTIEQSYGELRKPRL
jgi:hypothetical protein